MSYEPRGKVKALIDAMDADPSREWNTVAAAEVMQTTLSAVHAFVERAIAAGLLYRSLNNGRTVFSRKPFTEVSCVSRLPDVPTTATGWRPPTMGTPRGTPAPAQAATPAPAPIATRAPMPIRQPELTVLTQPPAPALALATDAEPAAYDEDGEETEEIEPDAFISCRTGEIVLVGLEPDEDGRVTVPADLVALIKRQIAWSPAA